MAITPFTDPRQITGPLYADARRLARRTSALHAAKASGSDATATIAELAGRASPHDRAPAVGDIGCGRGSTTLALAARLAPARVVALDQSAALLTVLAARARAAGHTVETVRADFHRLPLPTGALDLAVAAFCLYHSTRPAHVLREIARCLAPGGHAVLATKSAASYHHIDDLLAVAGLDPHAAARPSLYRTFPGEHASRITAQVLDVVDVRTEHHTFRFTDLDHLAAYLVTTPKYRLPAQLGDDARALAAALRARVPDHPLTTTSTITYVTARPR
jgi:SAM-dependent methyltransferase